MLRFQPIQGSQKERKLRSTSNSIPTTNVGKYARRKPVRVSAYLALLAALSAFLIHPTHSNAQTWQYVYGPNHNTRPEQGFSRVAPVKYSCLYDVSGSQLWDGYIAVGTSYTRDINGDIYVVRIKNDGSTAWEYQYDLSSANSADVGRSIIELSDGTGFVITGWTGTPTSDVDVAVLYIDCDGGIVWSKTVGSDEYDEQGYDIIETITGDPFSSPPNYPMDLVIAGGSKKRIGTQTDWDAYLLRITRTGTLLWDKAYDHTGHTDQIFYGLHESNSPLANQPVVGDILAAGYHVDNGRKQGYVARVSGANGNVVAAPHGFSHLGMPTDNEVFYSIVEQLDPAESSGAPYFSAQDVVVAGYTDNPGNKEIYLAKFDGGDPCVLQREWIIGDGPGIFGRNDDVAHMIYENPAGFIGSGIAQFDLLLTGYTDVPGPTTTERDMFFLSVNPATLQPTGGVSKQFGIAGDGKIEDGWSLHQVQSNPYKTNGYILCGESQSDPQNVGDVGDVYVVRTDINGNSGTTSCERNYPTVDEASPYPIVCLTPITRQTMISEFTNPRSFALNTPWESCSQDADPEKRVMPGPGEDWIEAPDFSSTVVPNMTSPGSVVHVRVASAEAAPVTLILSDALGKVVSRQDVIAESGDTEYEFSTIDLPKGIYFVGVHHGEDSWLERVLIQ